MKTPRQLGTLAGLCLLSLAAFGAPSVRDVLQIGPDTYLITSSSAFNGTSKKDAIIRVANDFANSKGKIAVAVSLKETRPAVGMGAQFEYQFKLVSPESDSSPQPVEACDRKSYVEQLHEDLVHLNDLREKRILTEEEFAIQKKRLLETSEK